MNTESIDLYLKLLKSLGIEDRFEDKNLTAKCATNLLADWLTENSNNINMTILDAPQPSTWIAIKNIPFYAFCEHHMVPFFGQVNIALLPNNKIAGFGSYSRLVDKLSRKPQLQERLTNEIASHIQNQLNTKALLVKLQARQLCMEMRKNGNNIICETIATSGLCACDHDYLRIAQNLLP